MNLQLDRIGQIAITVHDLDRAVAFYRDTLGMRFLFQVPNLAFFDCGGIRILLGKPEKPEQDHPGSVLYFKVADIQASWAALMEKGVKAVEPPVLVAPMKDHDLWIGAFEDLDGNPLALMAEVPRSS